MEVTLIWNRRQNGYIPSTVNLDKWISFRATLGGWFLAHDTLAHRAEESGTFWEEARALGATMYLMGCYRDLSQTIVNIAERGGGWAEPPPFEENDFTKRARENFAKIETEHLETWIGWMWEGFRYAAESEYTPDDYERMADINFSEYYTKHPQCNLIVNVRSGEVRIIHTNPEAVLAEEEVRRNQSAIEAYNSSIQERKIAEREGTALATPNYGQRGVLVRPKSRRDGRTSFAL